MRTTRFLHNSILVIFVIAISGCSALSKWSGVCDEVNLQAGDLIDDKLPLGWVITTTNDHPGLVAIFQTRCETSVLFRDSQNKRNDGILDVNTYSSDELASNAYRESIQKFIEEDCDIEIPVSWDNHAANQSHMSICDRYYEYPKDLKQLDYQVLYGNTTLNLTIWYLSGTITIDELKVFVRQIDSNASHYLP